MALLTQGERRVPSRTLRDRLGLPWPEAEPGEEEEAGPAKPPFDVEGEDVLMLWCETDEHGIRTKGWLKVVAESWHEHFAPGEG